MEEKCYLFGVQISKTPNAGRPVHNPYLKRDDVRRVLVKNYIAYYLIDEEEENIVVLRVVYNRRDQDKISKQSRKGEMQKQQKLHPVHVQ